jgi:tagatose 1,6-diphosphate aldolase
MMGGACSVGVSAHGRGEMVYRIHNPGELIDGDLELVLAGEYRRGPTNFSPIYRFRMMLVGQEGQIGRIQLRVRNTHHTIMYEGHIGYRVFPEHRGHRYAARACRLLLPLARRHGLETIWITCDPDNIASRRTCEVAGAGLVEIVDVPERSDMYQTGERQKCRYRLDL